tara:strand:+ start:295 stop:432 length:138 start_codon:yes stop_codon:yes gene_type:complete
LACVGGAPGSIQGGGVASAIAAVPRVALLQSWALGHYWLCKWCLQ